MIDRMPPLAAYRRAEKEAAHATSAAGDFAALLARAVRQGGPSEPAPAFNRERGGASHAVSFTALPLVGPVAVRSPASATIAASPLRVASSSPASRASPEEAGRVLRAPVPELDATSLQRDEPVELRRLAPINQSAARLRGRAPPVPATPPATASGSEAATRLANDRKAAGPDRPQGIRHETSAATGLAVHLVGGSGELRVVVRGAAMSVYQRNETIARIVKLMRSHGHMISEQSIDMEGPET